MSSSLALASSNCAQNVVLNRPHRSPKLPRGGKSKRTLIENACAACQKRKSRCNGQRPVCSRCQALHTECSFDTEPGESRWSALHRRSRILERERGEARNLIAQMQLRPELEAQEIYHRIRTDTHARDLDAFIHEATNDSVDGILRHQPQHQQQRQKDQQHESDPENLQHQQQQDQHQQQRPHRQIPQQLPQQQDTNFFFQTAYSTTGPTNQLPPLRSIVGVPTAGIDTTQQKQLPQTFRTLTQRNMSQVSAMSSGSYTSLSSSDGHSEQSVSPKADRPPRWAHSINN